MTNPGGSRISQSGNWQVSGMDHIRPSSPAPHEFALLLTEVPNELIHIFSQNALGEAGWTRNYITVQVKMKKSEKNNLVNLGEKYTDGSFPSTFKFGHPTKCLSESPTHGLPWPFADGWPCLMHRCCRRTSMAWHNDHPFVPQLDLTIRYQITSAVWCHQMSPDVIQVIRSFGRPMVDISRHLEASKSSFKLSTCEHRGIPRRTVGPSALRKKTL